MEDTNYGRRRSIVATVFVASSAALACEWPTEPVDKPMVDTYAVDTDGDGIPDVQDQCPGAPETPNKVFDTDGCPDRPSDLYHLVRQDVEQQWQITFGQSGRPYPPIRGFHAYGDGGAMSACGQLGPWNAWYCTLDASVYYHDALLDAQLKDIGDMAPAFIIAHEIGHHVSSVLGWRAGQNMSPKQNELQADCFGGAWTSSAARRGLLDSGDLQEAVAALLSVADRDIPWFDPRGHGTASQRVGAFNHGLANGANQVTGCTAPGWVYSNPDPWSGRVEPIR